MDDPSSARQAAFRLASTCLALLVAFVAGHFCLRWLMLHTGLVLGAVRPGVKVYRIVPLYVYWHPHFKTGVLIALVVLASFFWWAWRFCLRPTPARHIVPVLMIWHLAIAIAVALIDGGPKKLWEPYHIHHRSDYIGAVERIDSPRQFLHDYARLMPELPLHCRHHPPGGPLFLWWIARLFAAGPVAASWATLLAASLTVPAVYLWSREVLDEAPARLAACLFVLAPNVVCYTATCMDAVFMTPLVWSFYLLWKARGSYPLVFGLAAGLAASLAALMTFSISFVALWAVVLLAITGLADRPRRANTLLAFSMAVLTAAVFYFVLYAWSGYNLFEVLDAAFQGQAGVMKGRGHSSLRQSAFFALTNLVAFLFCAGLPLTVLWFQQLTRELRSTTASRSRWLTLSFALALLLVDLAPLYTLETERIWIFMVPMLAIGASSRLSSYVQEARPSPLAQATLLLLAGQTVIIEMLLDMVW
ncbi:MAG TPA: glycosyltransferase family 39 protein [Pirellulales bacterium]|nr:glycosyltransferase family 39 protein [Pirellulales bacterium]